MPEDEGKENMKSSVKFWILHDEEACTLEEIINGRRDCYKIITGRCNTTLALLHLFGS